MFKTSKGLHWLAAGLGFFVAGQAWAQLPSQWNATRATPKNYELATDRETVHTGKASVRIAHLSGSTDQFGGLIQAFEAEPFKGKRVRFAAWVKTSDADSAQLWMRIDGADASLAMDNMDDRAVKGTNDWREFSVVMDVPKEAAVIAYGLLLQGRGRAWIDDVTLGEVGSGVAETTLYRAKDLTSDGAFVPARRVLPRPVNLGFED